MRIALLLAAWMLAADLEAQPLRSLKTVPIPEPPELSRYVRDRQALVVLGKIFFWDMQAGSDGRTACASCHFHAGADHRAQNQLTDPHGPFPANYVLAAQIFPFRLFADPSNRGSDVLRDTSVRVGSAGLFRRVFRDIIPGEAIELGEEAFDKPEFITDGLQLRRVTVRNSPTVINAVFNVRNFWDGRASRVFNGFSPSGDSEQAPVILVVTDGVLAPDFVRLDNASLASQAVGPALDGLEMSYEGRSWPKLGKKLLSLRPLALQRVAPDDSVLGNMANPEGRGLREDVTYLGLLQAAFQPEFWQSSELVTSEFTQAEHNFSLFWGLALMAYQATLVSADSPFDRFMEGDPTALSIEQQEGMRLYQNAGRCTTCHGGAEFTAASFTAAGNRGNRAFQRTGVRSAGEDAGLGNGNFKTSGLRNVEFTGPFMHNGGQATLEQVVDFYARGGDFQNNSIRPFGANSTQKAALVAFMKAMSDERAGYERAPFDHPELCVPDGHLVSRSGGLIPSGSAMFPRSASERWVQLPAVGAQGNLVPLQTFDELLAGIGVEGSRAHAMTEACSIPLP